MPPKTSRRGRKPRNNSAPVIDSNTKSPEKRKTEWELMVEKGTKPKKKKLVLPCGSDRVSVPTKKSIKRLTSIAKRQTLTVDSDQLFTSSDEEVERDKTSFPLYAKESDSEDEQERLVPQILLKQGHSSSSKQKAVDTDSSFLPELAVLHTDNQVSDVSYEPQTVKKNVNSKKLTARQRQYISTSPDRSEVHVLSDDPHTPKRTKRSHHRSTPISSRKCKSPASVKKTPSAVLKAVIDQVGCSETDSTATTPRHGGKIITIFVGKNHFNV